MSGRPQEKLFQMARMEELQRMLCRHNGAAPVVIAGTVPAGVGSSDVIPELAITHNAGRIPTGMLVYSRGAAGDLKFGTTPATDSVVYIQGETELQTFKAFLVFDT